MRYVQYVDLFQKNKAKSKKSLKRAKKVKDEPEQQSKQPYIRLRSRETNSAIDLVEAIIDKPDSVKDEEEELPPSPHSNYSTEDYQPAAADESDNSTVDEPPPKPKADTKEGKPKTTRQKGVRINKRAPVK